MSPNLSHLAELLPRYDRPGPRYTSYPTAPVWSEEVGADAFRASLGRIGTESLERLSLYVHVPFCRALCHYCACNRVITTREELPKRYLEALELEVRAIRGELSGEPRSGQIHLGGGTPTHLTPDQLRHLMALLTESFPVRDDAELSIEVDPRVTTDEHVDALADCGFNRLSIGVQDFDPRVQAAVHRTQSPEQVAHLVDRARGSGFEGINFDLIYGLPFQTRESFAGTLERVIEINPDRIALYSYAHVTWVAKQQRGFERIDLPDASQKLEIMLMAIRTLLDAGYVHIGMDHFARRDDELARATDKGTLHRNFMGYTVRECDDLVAFGPSAISELREGYFQSVRDLGDWQERVNTRGVATFRGHLCDAADRRRAWIITQIMCQGRLNAAEYRGAFGGEFARDFAAELEELRPMEADELLSISSDGSFDVTSNGRVLLRNIAMPFDAYLAAQQESKTALFSKTV